MRKLFLGVLFLVITGALTYFILYSVKAVPPPSKLLKRGPSKTEKLIAEYEDRIKKLAEENTALRTQLEKLKSENETLKGKVKKLTDDIKRMEGLLEAKRNKEVEEIAQRLARMSPEKAAAVLENLDDRLVVEVLLKMPESKAGKIMDSLSSDKVSRVLRLIDQKGGGEKGQG